MDERWLRILMERGRLTPEVAALMRPVALLRQIRAGRVKGKYRRPQDLLRPPRNRAEREARQDLVITSGALRKADRAWRAIVVLRVEKIIGIQFKDWQAYENYQRQKALAKRGIYPGLAGY